MEFEKKNFLLGAFFLNWGQMCVNVLVEFKTFFNWGHFFQMGAMGANVLVEFEQKFILGSRKSAILGIIWTPDKIR